jgi:hypothetical protein
MTPEETLDWLAQQHFDQCHEERPIQDWIRKMKSQLPKQEQGSTTCDEPVAWIGDDGNLYHDYEKPHEEYGPEPTPLYTTPPSMKCEGPQQRKPLTDGQADSLIANLEPLLDAKNQSWANAWKMLIDILAAAPQGSRA